MLEREGEDAQTLVIFYTAVVQVVILYGLYSWVVPPRIGKTMSGFHNCLIRRLMGWMPRNNGDGTWTYPPLGGAMADVGLQ